MAFWRRRVGVCGVLFLTLIFFNLHCGGGKKQGEAESVASGGVDLDVAVGEELPPPYPHPGGWKDPTSHGAWVAKGGTATCLGCHQAIAVSQQELPSCDSCHSLYPHPEGWVQKKEHATFVRANGKESCATQCHGVDLKGGLSKISCNLCHGIYPHTALWKEAEEHGLAAKGDGKLICKGCHGDDLRGGTSGVSCYSCHAIFPHAPGWSAPNRHGEHVLMEGVQGCAGKCHGPDLQGGLSEVSCESCHSFYPHAAGWRDFEGHGRFVIETLGGDKTRCRNCHGNDLRGGRSGISCFSCHADYPHPADWRLPENHGPRAYGNLKSGCGTANCHGADFNGSPQAPSCVACHNVFPHTAGGWMALGNNDFHGMQFIQAIQRGEMAVCASCHGADYGRDLGGISCARCHARGITHIPRVEGEVPIPWASGRGHGSFFTASGFSSGAFTCGSCHGGAVDFTEAMDRDALNARSSCYRCHGAYPHLTWGEMAWRPWGHVMYQSNSPLFVDAAGRRAPPNINDPANIPVVQNSCAGSTELSCHFLGLRSTERANRNILCSGYCHTPQPERVDAPPQVSSRNPEDGAINVVVNSPIVVQFSEAMSVATIFNAFTVRRNDNGALVGGEVSCSPDWCRTATFRPRPNWFAGNTVYRATVNGAAQDLDGVALLPQGNSWTFTTDNQPPVVVSTVPADGSANVVVATSQLIVRFNEQIRCNSVRANTVALYSMNQQGNLVPLAGTTRCATPGNIYDTDIRFTISRGGRATYLAYGTVYVAKLFGGIQDLGGNANAQGVEVHRWSFTTEWAPDPLEE